MPSSAEEKIRILPDSEGEGGGPNYQSISDEKVTFKAEETGRDLLHRAAAVCGNDQVGFTSSIGDFDYEVGASEDA